jgi:hypothetical protein
VDLADNDGESSLTKAANPGAARLCQHLLAHGGARIDVKMNIQSFPPSVGAVLLPHTKAFNKAVEYMQVEAIVDQVSVPPRVILDLISEYLDLHAPKQFRSMNLTSNRLSNDVQSKHV